MTGKDDKIVKKRRKIVLAVKVIVYVLVLLMYYVFFQIMLLFLGLYTNQYKKDITVIEKQLIENKKGIQKIKNDIEGKKKKFFSLIMEINKNNKKLKEKQKQVLDHINNVLKKDLIAYGFYCSNIQNKIIKNRNNYIVDLNNTKLDKYGFLVKKRIKTKLTDINKKQYDLINEINKFYIKNCNQNTWFRVLVKKYFEKDNK